MKAPLAASTAPLEIFFRVTLKEGDVRENFGGDATLLIYTGDQCQVGLGRLDLRRQQCRDEHRWFDLTIVVPPHAEPLELHAEIEPMSRPNLTCGVRMTPGQFRKTQ
jgi:hypothetical protein